MENNTRSLILVANTTIIIYNQFEGGHGKRE